MDKSVWISSGALLVSIIALIYSIKNGISKANISISERRNSIRVDVHELALKLVLLVAKITDKAKSDQEVQVAKNLMETSEGMASMYKMLKDKLEVPWYCSTGTFITDYDNISSDLKEFNRILSMAEIEFNNGNIDQLERTVAGLRVRVLGSIKNPRPDDK